jgi:PAS domain S-box-containing protein
MWVMDAETLAFLDVNQAALARYGWTREEFLQMTARDIRPPGERLPEPSRAWPPSARLEPQGLYRHCTKDGTVIDVEISTQDTTLHGRRAHLVLSLDVSARVRTEAHRRFTADVATVLAASLDYQRTLASIAELAIAHLADTCTVHVPTGSDELELLTLASRDPETADTLRELARQLVLDPDATAGPVMVYRTRKPQMWRVVTDGMLREAVPNADQRAVLHQLGLRSAMMVPVATPSRTLGVLSLGSFTQGRHFSAADLQLAEELGTFAAYAIDHARLYAAAQREREAAEHAAARTSRLQAITAALSDSWSPHEVGSIVVEQGMAALGAHAGSVAHICDDGATMEVLYAAGHAPELLDANHRIPLDSPFPLTDVARSGEELFLATTEERERRYPHLAEGRPRLGHGPMLVLPLHVEARVIGALGLNFSDGASIGAADRAFAATLARQCAQALERTQLLEAERRSRALIEAARLEAEQANRTKTDFLAVMSHELRTPLNAIAGYTELLALGIRGPVTAAQLEDLSRIRRSQQHLLNLINDVLNFAKLETGNVNYDITDVPVTDVLTHVETLVMPQLMARRLRFGAASCPDDVTARADRDKLQQIVLNLVQNAVKFTDPGGRITVTCEAAQREVFIAVHDTGWGIPKSRQAHVFDPFVQVQSGGGRSAEGSGLGLAISRDLARAMGGELTVESEVGLGSVFTVRLPRGG